MRNRIRFFEIISFIIASTFGVLLHFFYNWSGSSIWTAPFASVSESVWEHLKLLYWPFLFTTLIGYYLIGRRQENYFFYQALSLSLGMAFFIVAFFTYSGIIGHSFLVVDIIIYYIGYIISYRHSYYCLTVYPSRDSLNYYGGILFMTYGILLIFFTFFTPHLGIFLDPQTGLYGI